MMKSFGVLMIVAIATGAVPAAAKTVYKCKIVQHVANGNSLPPDVYVEREGRSPKAAVMDGFIKNYLGTTAEAVVQTDNAARITFSWTLNATDANGDLTRMSFHLTYMKATGGAKMIVDWLGYTNQYSAEGTCKVR